VTRPASRPLGASGIAVSELSLGSWRTFERIPREAGVAVIRAARELGITFLDDARYNDETGSAPIKTGYSEVVFGELFRESGWNRDDVVLANKLWWEFWPDQKAEAELDASLGRMKMDHIDLIYAERPPDGLTVEEIVHDVGALISSGKARAWGVLNWPADLIEEAAKEAADQTVPPPTAAQLAYSLVNRSPVEDHEMIDALTSARASVVASFTLEGGALTGKYEAAGTRGRLSGSMNDERYVRAVKAGRDVSALAKRLGTRPSALAIAFALLNPHVASVLFGATKPEQIRENVSAIELASSLEQSAIDELRKIGIA
jgi:aryl-alcohol dehydrogenase-like predicted oxidoreductase